MVPPQRFYPTSWGFHPSEGPTAHLFTLRCAPDPEKHTPVRHLPPHSLTSRGGRTPPSGTRARNPGAGPGSLPVSAATTPAPAPAATAASATAAAAPTAAASAAARGVTAAVTAAVTAVMPARRGPVAHTARPGPPAGVAPAAAAAVRARGPAGPPAAPPPRHQPVPAPAPPCPADRGPENQDRDHRQDDAETHGATLLPFPRSGPPWAPRHPRDPHAVQRDRGMPGTPAAQSGVEQIQSFGAG